MTNKIGVTFRKGVWYKSPKLNWFFKYKRDREEGGVYVIEEVTAGTYRPEGKSLDWWSNSGLFDEATEATMEEIQPYLPYPFKKIENFSYQIY
jgi:hypothetical protein